MASAKKNGVMSYMNLVYTKTKKTFGKECQIVMIENKF